MYFLFLLLICRVVINKSTKGNDGTIKVFAKTLPIRCVATLENVRDV